MANMQDGALVHQSGGLMGQTAVNSPKAIRLMDLVDYLIQKAYHDLLILAEVELVSKTKNDMDKKIAIMSYLSRTRNYFIRFVALLEWSSSMTKVDKCFEIISFLERQSGLFVETADTLARMSRETLANSKLPCYQISFAVDVLNSRSSPRLPSAIKDKIVPPELLTEQETEQTLKELGFALWNRLITTDRPPLDMRNYVVRRGRVIFVVEKEFEVTLTVMGEDPTMPFLILDLRILVQNRRVGEGRPLVHPQQVMYLRQLLQSRIVENEKPLEEIYDLLHTFCQHLKLEVLFSQLTKHMIGGRLDFFRIESYTPGRELRISYWQGITSKKVPLASSKGHTVVVAVEPGKKDLVVTQLPTLDGRVALTDLDIGSLLMSVIHTRVRSRLTKLAAELALHFPCTADGFPFLLTVPLYSGSPRAHCVQISIDYYTGSFLVHLQQYSSKYIGTLRDALDAAMFKAEKVVEVLKAIRLELVMQLAVSSALYMHVQEQQKLYLYGGQPFDRYTQLGTYKTVFRFQRKVDTTALLGLSCHEDLSQPDGVRLDYHVLMVEETRIGLKILSITTMRDFLAGRKGESQAAFAKSVQTNSIDLLRARLKTMKDFREGVPAKSQSRRLHPATLDNFEQMVNHVMVQIMFAELRTALKTAGHTADATILDPLEGGKSLCCLTLPVCVSHPLVRSCIFRRVGKLHINALAAFQADVALTGVPFQNISPVAVCTLSYDSALPAEKIIKDFTSDWGAMLGLLRLMRRFKTFLDTKPNLAGIKYQVQYNLKTVKILYGPDLEFAMYLTWERVGKEENVSVKMDFYGCKGGIWNPHRMLRGKLMEMINPRNGAGHVVDFAHVFQVLAQTTPIALAARDSARPVGLNLKQPRSLTPQAGFQFIPLSLSHYVLIWKGTFCISVKVLAGPRFIVTDVGATEVARRSTDVDRRFQQLTGLELMVDTGLGKSGCLEIPPDQELGLLVAKFFVRFRGFPVQVRAASAFPLDKMNLFSS